MDDEIFPFVFLQRELEAHVSKERVAVEPPDPLGLRMREEEPPKQGKFGPVARQLFVQMRHIVDDFHVVEAAVVDLVLYRFEQEMVADGVIAGTGRRSCHQQDPIPGPAFPPQTGEYLAGKVWVFGQPLTALFVPVGDLGTQLVRQILEIYEVRGNGCAGIGRKMGSLVVGVGVGTDLSEDAVDVFDGFVLVLVWAGSAAQIADADGAAEDENGDQTAEDGDLHVVEGLLDLSPLRDSRSRSRCRRGSRQRPAAAAAVVSLSRLGIWTHSAKPCCYGDSPMRVEERMSGESSTRSRARGREKERGE